MTQSAPVTNVARTADRFAHAARHYTTGRPGYPAGLIGRVADLVELGPKDRVLDLGSGSGFLAIGFAAHAGQVAAIDPSPEMRDAARSNAAAAGVAIDVIEGSSYTLGDSLGRFRLVTIGRAFHWMDRADTLRRLETLVEPDGAVALFSDTLPDVPANAWSEAYDRVREKYSAQDRLGPQARSSSLSHEALLMASAFDHVERHAVIERRVTPLAHFVDRVLSFGATWTGSRSSLVQEVRDDIHAALTPFAVDGAIHEVVEGRAVIAWRSR